MGHKVCVLMLNLFTMLMNILVPRDEKVILIGAWMGTKFADNSRYLFQYLHLNKNELDIENVIWATRSLEVFNNLQQKGYHVCLCGTKDSLYWHLKAGMHIICDAIYTNKKLGLKADIDTQYSWGAKKIQLWHGNGIKAVGNASNEEKVIAKDNSFKQIIRNLLHNCMILNILTTEGGWASGNYKLLCKSEFDVTLFKMKFGCEEKDTIDANYPRVCTLIDFYGDERKVAEEINLYKKCILYLPTFRNNASYFIHPLHDPKLQDWLNQSDVLWIEKPHTASRMMNAPDIGINNVIFLDSSFDINVIIPLADLIITDYSSVMLDAMYFKKPIIYYVPDYEYYISEDVGLLVPFDDILVGPKVNLLDNLLENIEHLICNEFIVDDHYLKVRTLFWSHPEWSYYEIWNSIKNS